MATRRVKLRKARLNRGLSQEALAEALGTNQVTVSHWESGEVFPSPYFVGKLLTLFGLHDAAQLDIIYEEEERSRSREISAQPSRKEGELLVSASPKEERCESMRSDPEVPPRDGADPDEVLPALPTLVPTLITSNWLLPEAPIVSHFIASDMTRRLQHIAHTDYSTSDEMTNAIRAAIKEFDTMNTGESTYKITRREAMCELAALPMIALGIKQTLKASHYEEMLRYCTAALEGCWELSRGNDLEGKRHAYQCVCISVPMLETIAHDSPELRMQALGLATRYAILKTLLSWVGRIATPVEAVGCAQKALALSKETSNILLQTSAHTKLTWAYLRNKNYTKAWETIQQGKQIIVSYQKRGGQPLPSGIIGNFNSSYALTQAHNGLNPDTALGMALDSEPLPGYTAFVEFTEADQRYEAAKSYCLKGDPVRTIEQVGKLIETDTDTLAFLPHIDLTGGVRLHAINHLTSAFLQLPEPDMGQIINAWTIVMKGAQERHNEVIYDEAMTNFAIMRNLWRGEQAIRQLIPLTSHW